MLKIVFPLSFVPGTILMDIYTIAVGLVILPVTLIDVTIGMDQLPLAASTVVLSLTVILGSIGPLLMALAISGSVDPLAMVPGSVLQHDGIELDTIVVVGGLLNEPGALRDCSLDLWVVYVDRGVGHHVVLISGELATGPVLV